MNCPSCGGQRPAWLRGRPPAHAIALEVVTPSLSFGTRLAKGLASGLKIPNTVILALAHRVSALSLTVWSSRHQPVPGWYPPLASLLPVRLTAGVRPSSMKRFVIAIVAVALILVGGVLTFLFLQTMPRNPPSQDSVIWLGLALASCASIAASVHALRNQARLAGCGNTQRAQLRC